jgi:putative ABC transport system permease protein
VRFTWTTAFKIAWRESRSSAYKFLFVILAVAVGVGSLTGVRGFSRAFHDMLLSQARTLMAADLSLRVFEMPTPQQTAALDSLASSGVDHTLITETVTMASAGESKAPMLVSVKAVDPKKYPFYGEIRLSPPAPLSQALRVDTVAVSDDVLLRLNLKIGDTIRLGGQPFRIAGEVTYEPDRMLGSLNVGPRIMMTRAGLDRTGLMLPGSRAAERFLFRLSPQSPDIEQTRTLLRLAFPNALIADFRESHPIVTQALNRSTTFLSLVSLITLMIGAIGVGTAMRAHIQQRMDSIAIMKCIGARSSHVMRIYLVQTITLGLAGGLLGVAFGLVVQRVFPAYLARYFQLEPNVHWDVTTAAQGIGIAVLASLLFTLPPLISIRSIRPGLILRREMEETKPNWRTRLWQARASIAAGAIILIGFAGIAMSFATGTPRDIWRTGAYFTGAVVISFAALSAVAWLMLRVLKAAGRAKLPATVRHGLANLYRPGAHAQSVLVALGVGVMFTLTVYFIQRGLIAEMNRSSPPGMPNVFLIDIAPKDRDAVLDLVKRQHGVKGAPEVIGTVAAKIVSIDGRPVDQMELKGYARRYRSPRSVSSAGAMPNYVELMSGQWWDPSSATPQVCVDSDAARILHVYPGSEMVWTISGREVQTRVACVENIDSVHLWSRVEFIFNSTALANFPVIYYSSLRAQPPDVPALQ